MSYRDSRHYGSSRDRDRDRDRRRSPSPSYRRSGGSSRHRSPGSPGPSRDRDRDRHSERRDEKSLPGSFSKDRDRDEKQDNRNVLDQMSTSFDSRPLEVLHRCIKENLKVKVWTRNYKEVRGICTGYVLAFDKHWNLVMRDVDEVCLKPKKGKTPYLRHLQPGDSDTIPEAKPKEPKKKKDDATKAKSAGSESETAASATESATESMDVTIKSENEDAPPEEPKKKKKKRRKNKGPNMAKRHVNQLFVRGDNIVMVAVLAPVST